MNIAKMAKKESKKEQTNLEVPELQNVGEMQALIELDAGTINNPCC